MQIRLGRDSGVTLLARNKFGVEVGHVNAVSIAGESLYLAN